MVQKRSAVRAAFHRSRDVQIVLFDAELSVYFLHEVKIICFLCIPSLEVIQMIYDKKGN